MKFFSLIFCLFISFFSSAQQIFDLDPEVRENSIEINNAAVLMISDGNYEMAARILEKVIEDDPSFHPAYLNFYRAGGQVQSKKEKVIQTLRAGLLIFEEDDEMAYYLGNILQREKRIEEAITAYSDAIRYSKINGEEFELVWAYHFNRGNCYLKSSQHDKAIIDYNNALKHSPSNADILTNRGFCYYKVKNNVQACEDWKEAKRLGNTQTDKYLQSFCK
ncbi:tetratricopeptide repeat protein [Aquiflexum sp. LQ15W]|uniref:tetratricopeptide repeat protein n=1 Tax=Cognataquiflexum nitidum TaxID=2922272 RepID=UPI001F12C99D|nr:tetratricopeptide repeat protein [Cognataquiflexum nitidum]MCH6200627.1 tetratricopeptide repeat protein [Cognataquiflexum nitidum]